MYSLSPSAVAPWATLLVLCPFLLGIAACTSPPQDDLIARLDAMIQYELADKDIPTLSLAVVEGDRVRWAHGYGPADPSTNTPATGETVYRVASISKLFNAMAVMQLVEQGMLDLDAPIQTYLPDFQPTNPFDQAVTLRQILAHRSGLVREPPVGHYFDDTAPSLAATVESMNATTLVYAPTTLSKYSNAAVSVSGYVIEATQNQPYADYVQTHLLAAMGLAHTSFAPRPDLRDALATGYMWTYDGRTFEAPVFELGMMPAANLYTTMTDLAQFMHVLFAQGQGPNGAVLKPETLEEMWTVQFEPPGTKNGFGLGFYVSDFHGKRRVQHSGVMYGYATRVFAMPDDQLGVAIVNNMDATNTVVDRIGNYALELLLAEKNGAPLPDFPRTEAVDPVLARQLDGRYTGPRTLELIERDGGLYLFNGTERHRLKQRGDTLVVDDRLAYGYWLLPQPDGLHTSEGVFARAEQPRPARLDHPEAALVGEYGWDHNVLYILERDATLYALIEWFFYYPLQRLGPDHYTFPEYGLYAGERLDFLRDKSGNVRAASVAGVAFARRTVAPEEGNTFQITPLRPVEALREEALAATSPTQPADLRTPDLVDVTTLDPTFKTDVRYATTNNFMGAVFYQQPRVFLQRPAAEALARVQADLRAEGLGLILYDGYRPWYVTKMFWDATPDNLKNFVANPANGSRHNRGAAIDLGLYDLATGNVLEMPSGYDEFTPRAFADYPGGTARARWHRERLRDAMEAHGFTVYPDEWWHYDYQAWREYPVLNQTFEALDTAR